MISKFRFSPPNFRVEVRMGKEGRSNIAALRRPREKSFSWPPALEFACVSGRRRSDGTPLFEPEEIISPISGLLITIVWHDDRLTQTALEQIEPLVDFAIVITAQHDFLLSDLYDQIDIGFSAAGWPRPASSPALRAVAPARARRHRSFSLRTKCVACVAPRE
jgi:hypothetical protein